MGAEGPVIAFSALLTGLFQEPLPLDQYHYQGCTKPHRADFLSCYFECLVGHKAGKAAYKTI